MAQRLTASNWDSIRRWITEYGCKYGALLRKMPNALHVARVWRLDRVKRNDDGIGDARSQPWKLIGECSSPWKAMEITEITEDFLITSHAD